MKAVKYSHYGTPDVIHIIDTNKPIANDNEILVNVFASSLSPSECAFRKADPFIVRFFSGLTAPKTIPGDMFAGIVDSVEANVVNFRPGDRVFGTVAPGTGTHAEYVVLDSNMAIVKLPERVSYQEGASLADGAITALPFLRNHGKIKANDHILINGASGSIGTYAIQLAKYYGATVTAVCSAKNSALAKELSADEVIDYAVNDFTKNLNTYDIIFDVVGKSSYRACKLALKSNGIYLTTIPNLFLLLHSILFKKKKGKKAIFAATGIRKPADKILDFNFLSKLAAEGQLRSVIDKVYTFDTIKEGHIYVEKGRKVGNVSLMISTK